jgi:hypothetical protein
MMRPREPSIVFALLTLLACGGASTLAPPAAPPSEPSAVAPDPAADPPSLAVPGPAASPCTDDSMCNHHRCNLEYGKCAFPCVTDADCTHGTTCFKAVISTCQPKPPNEP